MGLPVVPITPPHPLLGPRRELEALLYVGMTVVKGMMCMSKAHFFY